MRVLVTSKKDIASQTIKRIFIEDYGFAPTGESFEGSPILAREKSAILITTERDMIYCEHLEAAFEAEAFIFCSRHRAESGKPALLVHSTGNFSHEAAFGGNPRELSVSAPSLVSAALKRLFSEREERNLHNFDVTLEVTHHGPTSMNSPLVFVELGSTEEYWVHPEGARAVSAAIFECINEPLECEGVIGFGGTHYASKFNRLVLEKGYKIGHMAPKYVLNDLNPEVIKQMMNRSRAKTRQAIIDWKGMNAENKEYVFPLLEDAGLEIVRDKDA